jgi:hypothetical protein
MTPSTISEVGQEAIAIALARAVRIPLREDGRSGTVTPAQFTRFTVREFKKPCGGKGFARSARDDHCDSGLSASAHARS